MQPLDTVQNAKNGSEIGQCEPEISKPSRAPKSHEGYWKTRLRRRTYRTSAGLLVAVPEWQVKLSHAGCQRWVNLQTANRTAAARAARDTWAKLKAKGWEAIKPAKEKTANPTVGEFLEAVRVAGDLKAATFEIYAGKFRRLVAGVFGIHSGKNQRATEQSHGSRWLARVSAVRFSRLTTKGIQRWKTRYIAAAAAVSPLQERKARRTVASVLRSSKALFAPAVIARLHLALPKMLPLDGVDVPRVSTSHYVSRIEPEILFQQAKRELESPSDELLRAVASSLESRSTLPLPPAGSRMVLAEERRMTRAIGRERQLRSDMFRILCLALFAGLRRDEIDTLTWRQIDFSAQTVRVETNAYTAAKSEGSEVAVDIDPGFAELIRSWMMSSTSEFVVSGGVRPRPQVSRYHHYRCGRAFKVLSAWLRSHGLEEGAPIHALRKEFGTQINRTYGLFAASAALRHTSIQLTRSVYLAKKDKAVFALPTSPTVNHASPGVGPAELREEAS